MSTETQFFSNPFCKNSLNYWMAWFFFILSNSFFMIIIFVNPFKFYFYDNVVKLILFSASLFITSILSRFICYSNKNKDEIYNNILDYDVV